MPTNPKRVAEKILRNLMQCDGWTIMAVIEPDEQESGTMADVCKKTELRALCEYVLREGKGKKS